VVLPFMILALRRDCRKKTLFSSDVVEEISLGAIPMPVLRLRTKLRRGVRGLPFEPLSQHVEMPLPQQMACNVLWKVLVANHTLATIIPQIVVP